MGYSARYHAASLAAVFFALAIGILIGSQIGGEILDNTRRDLESSLTSDLDSARAEVDGLKQELARANEFGDSVYPSLTARRLQDERIGLIGFGSLPSGLTDRVGQAIEPTSAELVAVGVVRRPPDLADLSDSLGGTRFSRLDRRPALTEPYGEAVGRQLVTGGRILQLSRSSLMSESSGQFGNLDGLIIYRGNPEEPVAADADLSALLDDAMIEGMRATRASLVGVEEVSTDPSSVAYFSDRGISSVDNVDLPSGRVSLVYALAGAQGSFGVKESAGRLLPDLLRPLPTRPQAGGEQG
jgi:hypothetical protein